LVDNQSSDGKTTQQKKMRKGERKTKIISAKKKVGGSRAPGLGYVLKKTQCRQAVRGWSRWRTEKKPKNKGGAGGTMD